MKFLSLLLLTSFLGWLALDRAYPVSPIIKSWPPPAVTPKFYMTLPSEPWQDFFVDKPKSPRVELWKQERQNCEEFTYTTGQFSEQQNCWVRTNHKG